MSLHLDIPRRSIRLFLYARKSTDVEDKQILSIDAQLNELREFAARECVIIVDEFVEKQSAKKPGRPVFNEMIARIEAGEAEGILSWHPDRLARNSIDGGRIIYLLDTNKLKTLKFPRSWFENTPQGKLMLHNEFGFSKYYVDALGENTKRGLREKVRRGEFPSVAPIGYLNDRRTKRIVLDRVLAPIVKKAFDLYSTGKATLLTIRVFFAEHGVLSTNNRILSNSTVSKILSNPFYYGDFKYGGEIHHGTHEPLISKALFDKVQSIFNARWRYSPSENKSSKKPYLGLLRCPTCEGAITAEVQKGHTYYRCTKKIRNGMRCDQPYIRAEDLDKQISSLIESFTLSPSSAEHMLALLEEEKRASADSAIQLAKRKKAELESVQLRLQKLLSAFLDGIIDRSEYLAEKATLMSKKKSLEERVYELAKGRADWLEPFENWIKTAQIAAKIAKSGSSEEKKDLALKIFGSNLVLDRKRARGLAVKPWSVLPKISFFHKIVPAYTVARTHFLGMSRLRR